MHCIPYKWIFTCSDDKQWKFIKYFCEILVVFFFWFKSKFIQIREYILFIPESYLESCKISRSTYHANPWSVIFADHLISVGRRCLLSAIRWQSNTCIQKVLCVLEGNKDISVLQEKKTPPPPKKKLESIHNVTGYLNRFVFFFLDILKIWRKEILVLSNPRHF